MLLILVAWLLSFEAAQAATYYASKTASNGYAVGSDSNTCTQALNKATPKSTIWGTNGAKTCIVGGDQILVNEGTYTEEILNPPAGTASNYTTIKADPASSRPLLRPDGAALKRGFYCSNGSACAYIRFEGFDIGNAYNSIKLASPGAASGYPHHVQIVNNVMHDSYITNVETNTSDTGGIGGDHLFQGNEFYNTGIHNPGYGPGYNSIYNPGNRTIIERNRFHNLHNGVGIWLSNKYLYDIIVRDNLFYDIGLVNTDTWQAGATGYSCIHISSGGGGHQIYNNVCRNSGEDANFRGININPQLGKTTLTGITIYNNTIYDVKHASAYGIRASANMQTPSGATVKNNIVLPVTGGAISDASGVSALVLVSNRTSGTASAIFTNPGSGDLTLKAGSVAIDAGTACVGSYNGASCDQGAYEVPVFSSCVVNAGATSVVRVTLTNNRHPPMNPASTVTGVTFRKNTVSNPVVSVLRVGDNIYDFTLTNAYIGSDTPDMSASSTNWTDSALIGNTSNQPFVTTLTNQSCTNNAGGAPAHTFTQARYELHDWRGLEASPTMLPHGYASTGAAENFANYKVVAGGKIRVRFALTCGGANCPDSAFYPYVSTGGGYARILDDFSVHNIKMCGTPDGTDQPSNGSASTNQLSTAGTFAAGGVVFTSNAVPTITGLNNGYKTEIEYCFALNTTASGNFDIRMYLEDGTALNTYTVTPRLVAEPAAAGGM